MSAATAVQVRCPYCGAELASVAADRPGEFVVSGKCGKRDCRAQIRVTVKVAV